MTQVKDDQALLLDAVQDLYSNEQQTVDRLGPVVDATTTPELKTALARHRVRSGQQARRLEEIAGMLGDKADGAKSLWADGILEDSHRDIKDVEPGRLLDIALAGAIRKLEHAEIVSYETAIGLARRLAMTRAVELLVQTHSEELAMDDELKAALERALGEKVD